MTNLIIGFIYGADLVGMIFVAYLLWQRKQDKQLAKDGEKLLEKMVARKQFDFFYNETVRLFVMATEAKQAGDLELLNKIADQHSTAVIRYNQARQQLLALDLGNES